MTSSAWSYNFGSRKNCNFHEFSIQTNTHSLHVDFEYHLNGRIKKAQVSLVHLRNKTVKWFESNFTQTGELLNVTSNMINSRTEKSRSEKVRNYGRPMYKIEASRAKKFILQICNRNKNAAADYEGSYKDTTAKISVSRFTRLISAYCDHPQVMMKRSQVHLI